MKKPIKIIGLYQVVMHYRIPFYESMTQDDDFEFKLLYGKGKNGTKLINSTFDKTKVNAELLADIRIPLPFTPSLFFKLMQENPSIVFSEGSSSLINASIGFLYTRLFRKKFIWWSLGILEGKKYTGLRKIINHWEHFIERKADAIFTYSTKGKKYFESRGVKPHKIYVGVNVFDTTAKLKEIKQTYDPEFLDKNYFNIGFIGTIEKTKNLETLIDAVQRLNIKYKNIKLNIIGDGKHLPELKKYTLEIPNIVFYGRMNQGASKVLSNCDVFVLPGLGGLAICEGMLNGLPIITGLADGTEYDLVDESNGFIIENMTTENLIEKIEFMINNKQIIKIMRQASFKKITEDLSFENYYKVFKTMISEIK